MTMTAKLSTEAIHSLEHANKALRQLDVIARMGAIPTPDQFHRLQLELQRVCYTFESLHKALIAQGFDLSDV